MLRGKGIETACCGNGFSIFRTHNGLLMSCGYGQDGCLGKRTSGTRVVCARVPVTFRYVTFTSRLRYVTWYVAQATASGTRSRVRSWWRRCSAWT